MQHGRLWLRWATRTRALTYSEQQHKLIKFYRIAVLMFMRWLAMRLLLIMVSAFILASEVNAATYVSIVGPRNATLYNNQSIYLGKVGPGESFYISASPNTTNAQGQSVVLGWDTIEAISLPAGWDSQKAALYEDPMKMKVTVPSNAKSGKYMITVRTVNLNNYSKIGNLTFYAYVNVTPDVFRLIVTPSSIDVGPGQPGDLYVTINNTGISDDPFIINAYGLPAWNSSDEVISLHSTRNSFVYPVYLYEPGSYRFNLTVSSATSPLINESYGINMTVKEDLANDYQALDKGIALSPVIEEPVYSFISILDSAYRYISAKV